MEEMRTAIVGCGKRTRNIYLPILKKMKDVFPLVCVCSRSEDSARAVAGQLNIPCYTDLQSMIRKEKFDLAIVNVGRFDHASPALALINAGIPLLLETPIADSLSDAEDIIKAADKKGVSVEIAENVYRQPESRIIGKLIREGIFGRINTLYTDFTGHGYHGLSLIRSFIGFNTRPLRVCGFNREFPVQRHVWRQGQPERDSERWEHGIIEYNNGSVGLYDFSSLTYGSPMRREKVKNTMRFYAEKGMGSGHDLVVVENREERRAIPVKRITSAGSGEDILQAYEAGAGREIIWENPLKEYPLSDYEIGVASCLMELAECVREKKAPEYGPVNAFIDRQTEIAIVEAGFNEKGFINLGK